MPKQIFHIVVSHPIFYNTAIAILTILSWSIINKIRDVVNKQGKSLHYKFFLACGKGIVTILAILALVSQFQFTKEFALTLFQSTSLMVAVIGFAAQAVLADIIAGMVLSISKPFDIGERIVLEDKNIAGIVEDITLRHTVIKAYDGSRVLIPNSAINKAVLRNSNFDGNLVGTFLEVDVSYESDLDQAMEIVKEIVLQEPTVVDKSKGNSNKEISVLLSSMNASGVTIKTTIWTRTVDESFKTASNIRKNIIKRFSNENIEIPYPHITLAN